ncbi:MAG: DciA family protein [Candidatus Moraniibacteriota bacterium]
MRALGDILNRMKKRRVQVLDDKTIFFVFKKVIEEEFGAIGRQKFNPEYFANKILFIRADNSIWSAELWTNKARIIKKINEELGEDGVENIKMK